MVNQCIAGEPLSVCPGDPQAQQGLAGGGAEEAQQQRLQEEPDHLDGKLDCQPVGQGGVAARQGDGRDKNECQPPLVEQAGQQPPGETGIHR